MTRGFLLLGTFFMVFTHSYAQQISKPSDQPHWMVPRLNAYMRRHKKNDVIPHTPEDVRAWYSAFPLRKPRAKL